MIYYLQSGKIGPTDESQDIFSFVVDTMESAIKLWHETGKVDPRVYFLLDKQKTQTDKYAPVVNIDKVLIVRLHIAFIHMYICCL